MKEQEEKENLLWTVPALFREMQNINDIRYLPKAAGLELERVRQAEKNVEFYQTQSIESLSYLTSFRILAIRSNGNIS